MKPSDNEIEMLAAGFAIQHKNGLIRFAHALLEKYASARASTVAGEAQPVIHQHGFASDNQKLRAINESLDKQLEQLVTERDEYHDMADKLANAIADHLLIEIGEHSSSNCPWMRALEAIENAAPQASAEDVHNAALEKAARLMEQTGKRIAASDIRALKSQADKNGGQQRAGDEKEPR